MKTYFCDLDWDVLQIVLKLLFELRTREYHQKRFKNYNLIGFVQSKPNRFSHYNRIAHLNDIHTAAFLFNAIKCRISFCSVFSSNQALAKLKKVTNSIFVAADNFDLTNPSEFLRWESEFTKRKRVSKGLAQSNFSGFWQWQIYSRPLVACERSPNPDFFLAHDDFFKIAQCFCGDLLEGDVNDRRLLSSINAVDVNLRDMVEILSLQ